jgi:hypothetical protein
MLLPFPTQDKSYKKIRWWAGAVTQVLEHLLFKHEALSSNPPTEREKN